jgi:hypothetical protein
MAWDKICADGVHFNPQGQWMMTELFQTVLQDEPDRYRQVRPPCSAATVQHSPEPFIRTGFDIAGKSVIREFTTRTGILVVKTDRTTAHTIQLTAPR